MWNCSYHFWFTSLARSRKFSVRLYLLLIFIAFNLSVFSSKGKHIQLFLSFAGLFHRILERFVETRRLWQWVFCFFFARSFAFRWLARSVAPGTLLHTARFRRSPWSLFLFFLEPNLLAFWINSKWICTDKLLRLLDYTFTSFFWFAISKKVSIWCLHR